MNKDNKKIIEYIRNGKVKCIPRMMIDKEGNATPLSFDFSIDKHETNKFNTVALYDSDNKNDVVIDLSKLKGE